MDSSQFVAAIQQMEGLTPSMKERLLRIADSLPQEKRREIVEMLSPLEKRLTENLQEGATIARESLTELRSLERSADKMANAEVETSAQRAALLTAEKQLNQA